MDARQAILWLIDKWGIDEGLRGDGGVWHALNKLIQLEENKFLYPNFRSYTCEARIDSEVVFFSKEAIPSH